VEGTPFGRYRLLNLLGGGGMGEVWRAFDTETKRVVALKLLPTSAATDEVFEERFRREAESAAGLNDPHVVPIHHFGEIDGRLYVDMRLVEGRDLDVLLTDGALHPARAVRIVEQVASALSSAHRIGLVHRDVKPSNILLTEDDFAYLIDFGIARTADDKPLTSTGMTIGTWAYMAPERFTTGATDPRGDVYALACVLYQCLTGSQPFPGNSIEQAVSAHMFAPPPRPSEQNHFVSEAFDEVIARGMAKRSEDRYATATQLAAAARNAASAFPADHLGCRASFDFASAPHGPLPFVPALGAYRGTNRHAAHQRRCANKTVTPTPVPGRGRLRIRRHRRTDRHLFSSAAQVKPRLRDAGR
jgi:serine/threonine protein kinase